ncbi:MAG: hypothetical protein Q9190_000746 [Brigantiaea leucoxantha]
MPLPDNKKLIELSNDLIAQFRIVFGHHKGYRPTHARGVLVSGTFVPASAAHDLSAAPHFSASSTPVTIRFSSSTGIPLIPDTDPSANPRGLAIRFHLGDHVHTDVISHSTPFFPVRDGALFLDFLKSIAASPPGAASPSPIEQFLGSHPAALAFVQAPKPTPVSFAQEAYYGVNALKFVNSVGKATFIRYRVIPLEGTKNFSEAELAGKDAGFLYDELPGRLHDGGVTFKLCAQVAEEGDVTDDATVHWPESRKVVDLGTLKLESIIEENKKEQKHIIFDPIPRIKGIEPSEDPLLELRAALYLVSGRERRAAEQNE